MIQSHTGGNCCRSPGHTPHFCHRLEDGALLRGDMFDAVLIEGGDAIEQSQELIPYRKDRVTSDQLVEHHIQTRIAVGDLVDGVYLRT